MPACCRLCHRYSDYVIFVIGWANVLRCSNCIIKLGKRKDMEDKPFEYWTHKLIKTGIEMK